MDPALARDAEDAGRAVRAGALRGDALWARLLAVPYRERDAWVDEVLGLARAHDGTLEDVDLPRGAVPYLPCGVDAIVHALRDAPVGAGDVFVDLGAGLGRVALLAHLLTGARALGVELQAPLVARARDRVRALALDDVRDVRFVRADAATLAVDALAAGTVFFSYASFSPAVLARVLQTLRAVAALPGAPPRRRALVLCAVGFDVDAPWLRPRASGSPEVALYDAHLAA